MTFAWTLFGVLFAPLVPALSAKAASPAPPQAGQRVVVLGDSITHSGQYVVDLETAWRLRDGEKTPAFLNLGLPSETACGLSEPGHLKHGFPRPDLHERLGRVLEQTRPQVVLACYGMNDGLQMPFDEERFRAFQDGMNRLHDAVARAGARIVHVTPPVYDGPYDEVLARYAAWLLAQRARGWEVIDLHGPMRQAVEDRRATEPGFTFARDKVHPNAAGHRVMAQALWDGFFPGDTRGPAALPDTPAARELRAAVERRANLLRDAWLTATGHKRPGLPTGKPLEEAGPEAETIAQRIAELAALVRPAR